MTNGFEVAHYRDVAKISRDLAALVKAVERSASALERIADQGDAALVRVADQLEKDREKS